MWRDTLHELDVYVLRIVGGCRGPCGPLLSRHICGKDNVTAVRCMAECRYLLSQGGHQARRFGKTTGRLPTPNKVPLTPEAFVAYIQQVKATDVVHMLLHCGPAQRMCRVRVG